GEEAVDGLLVIRMREDSDHARAAHLADHRVDALRTRLMEQAPPEPVHAADSDDQDARDDDERDGALAHGDSVGLGAAYPASAGGIRQALEWVRITRTRHTVVVRLPPERHTVL